MCVEETEHFRWIKRNKPTSTHIPVRTQRHFNVHKTSPQRYGRCIDVETMLCSFLGQDFSTCCIF